MKRPVSTALMVIYWIALPLSALIMAGLGWALLAADVSKPTGGAMPLWLSFVVSVLLNLLIVWRLWIHERARRRANEAVQDPSPRGRGKDRRA